MQIAVGQLGLVLAVGLIAGTGLVSVFAVGVLGVSRANDARRAGHAPASSTALAWLCFGLCGAAVLYGIYLLIPQLH